MAARSRPTVKSRSGRSLTTRKVSPRLQVKYQAVYFSSLKKRYKKLSINSISVGLFFAEVNRGDGVSGYSFMGTFS